MDPHGGALKWWWCQYQQHTPRGGEGPYSPPIRGLGGLYLASQVYGECHGTPYSPEITHTHHTPPLGSSTCHTSPPNPLHLHPTPGGGRRPNPLVSGCYGGGTRGFRHCRWSGAMWGRLGCSRAVKYAGGCGWWGVGGFGQLFFKVYFIFTVFCELSQMMPLRPHTWAYITNIACMGLLDYIMTLITNIKHRKPGPHHPDLPQTHHHSTNLGGGVDVQIRWFPGAMAVGLWALDTADGIG